MTSGSSSHEIERKFLVTELPADFARHLAEAIAQGYLARDGERGVEVRVRQKAGQHFLTVKVGGGQSRVEVELPLGSRDFAALWPATEGRRITKTRRRLPVPDSADRTIELDVYEGTLAGLHVAEVEFPDEAAARAFQPPAWFGREVTDEPAYRNAALAREGLPASHPALTHGSPIPPR